eukprot:TRINITY_DN8735_c0_g2_i1.p1 TRINITY_DN8735_c0_g2~~TRINITY_DN8735_c0_g2_i1.p1  ORF type:complete len:240 (-),score=64.61 TRINITY_DN8735_c0_g2_i1:146-760(-)
MTLQAPRYNRQDSGFTLQAPNSPRRASVSVSGPTSRPSARPRSVEENPPPALYRASPQTPSQSTHANADLNPSYQNHFESTVNSNQTTTDQSSLPPPRYRPQRSFSGITTNQLRPDSPANNPTLRQAQYGYQDPHEQSYAALEQPSSAHYTPTLHQTRQAPRHANYDQSIQPLAQATPLRINATNTQTPQSLPSPMYGRTNFRS